MGKQLKQWKVLFCWSPKSLQIVTAAMKLKKKKKKHLLLGRKAMTQLDNILKIRYITLWQSFYSQSYDFSNSHVWLWELDHKEGWAPQNWCFWTVVLENTLESPFDCKKIKPVNPKGDQSWIFTGRVMLKLKLQYCGDLMRTDSPEKTMMLGNIEGGGEEDERGWDGWMVSPTWWTWIWLSSRSWSWTGKPGVLQSIESHTELNLIIDSYSLSFWLFALWLFLDSAVYWFVNERVK